MGRVVYSTITSLDGVNAGPDGDFTWAYPGEEVIEALNADLAQASTYLYGRRMYEMMAVWETDPHAADGSPSSAVFADIWRAADKVVFSTTLDDVWTSRTTLRRSFDASTVRSLAASTDGDLTVEGPTLARQALAMGLVDVVDLVVCPTVVGGGNAVFPTDVRVDLRLTRSRTFENGFAQLTYEVVR